MTETDPLIDQSLLAIARGNRQEAAHLAGQASRAKPTSLLARALARFLDSDHDGNVYAQPDGFEDFIDNGGNPALYSAVIDHLRDAHRTHQPRTYLDIGCGDGRVTAAVRHDAETIGLVEPSAALLSTAHERLAAVDTSTRSFAMTIEEMLETDHSTWDLVQSTFALHTLEPSARTTVLEQLARRTRQLLIVEFDVPDFADRSAEHAAYTASAYERGLAEYAHVPRVHQQFLLPVLVGQFDPTQQRNTHEQSSKAWTHDLLESGWDEVRVSPIAEYWWAPAILLDARIT